MEIINPDKLPEEFILSEIKQVEKEKNRVVEKAEFYRQDDDNAREVFYFKPVNFDRIRRITGYLVGTLDRFNNGKRAEEHDRVKHTVD